MSLGRLTSLYRDIGIYIYKYHFRGLNPLGGTSECVAI